MNRLPPRRSIVAPLLMAALLTSANTLLGDAPPQTRKPLEPLPVSRGGQEVVGKRLPPLAFDRWIPADPPAPDEGGRPPVTLYRWWTTGCPFCEKTLPAIEALRRRYEGRGLSVVAVFHPKPAGAVVADRVAKAAKRMGYAGRVAVDEDWSELKRAYLDRSATAAATSVTLLVDRDGVVRFVHPGPQFFPSDDAADAGEDADYKLIDRALAALLSDVK